MVTRGGGGLEAIEETEERGREWGYRYILHITIQENKANQGIRSMHFV